MKKGAIIAIAAAALVVVLLLALTIYTYAYSGIFPGVRVYGVDVGGMSVGDASAAITAACGERYAGKTLMVNLEDVHAREISSDELKVEIASDELAAKAHAIGHEGGYFERIFTVLGLMFGGREIDATVTVDEAAMTAIAEELAHFDAAPVDGAYTLEDEGATLVLHPNTDGKALDKEAFIASVKERFLACDYTTLDVTRTVSESVALDLDRVYSEVHKEVADAHLEKGESGNKIIPHVVGVDFDLAAAKEKFSETPDEVIKIPLSFTQPKVLTKHLETNLFKYCLSDVTTRFSPKKVARTANVRLSAKLVNGTILNPGEVFSYNETVGPRTAARGFKEASIFSQGEVVDGIGGGICQTSSTIYMAAVKANMETVERSNHSFYVDYAPKGEDATVVYGSLDYKFKNTSEYPIKIVATSENNWIRVKIMGTEPDEIRTVKLTKKTHSQTPYTTREKETTDLPEGKREVEQKGQPGLSMTVYRNVYDKSGKLIESYVENKSKYKPMPEIVLVGVAKKAEETKTETPATEATAPAAPEPSPAPAPESTTPAEPAPAPETPEEPATEVVPESAPEVAPEPAPAPAEPTPAPETTDNATAGE